tara:strand:+ start:764 stop:1351 length:588 start_codon:yes stop_codon:yes gene_type:complete
MPKKDKVGKRAKKKREKRVKKDKKKKSSLRVVNTISPVSVSTGKSGLERDIEEVDLERFSEFVSLGDSATSLEQEAPVANLEEVPDVPIENEEKNEEGISYETNVSNAYADSGAYASNTERSYESTGGGMKGVNVDEMDLSRRNDFVEGNVPVFVGPEMRDQKNDDYNTRGDRAYSSLDSSGKSKESKKKRERGF